MTVGKLGLENWDWKIRRKAKGRVLRPTLSADTAGERPGGKNNGCRL